MLVLTPMLRVFLCGAYPMPFNRNIADWRIGWRVIMEWRIRRMDGDSPRDVLIDPRIVGARHLPCDVLATYGVGIS